MLKKAFVELLPNMASCCQAVSCHQPMVNRLFTVSISRSGNINKFWIDIFNSQSHTIQVFQVSLTYLVSH